MKKQRTKTIRKNEPIFSLPFYRVNQTGIEFNQLIDWGTELLNIPNFWKSTRGKGIRIAIIDSGIAPAHTDLQDSVIEAEDFSSSKFGTGDTIGHGTHVAGIIAARNNSSGVVGIAYEAKLLIAKVVGDDGLATPSAVEKAIHWAIKNNADIINISLGAQYDSPIIKNAIEEAIDKGLFIICSAGNNGANVDRGIDYPGRYQSTIAVGSVDHSKKVSHFTSRGDQLDIVAPGEEILSTYPPNGFARLSGTSMAAPFVTGITALALSKHRQYGGSSPLTNQHELREHLEDVTTDLGIEGFDINYGYGLIKPEELINRIIK